MEVTSRYCFDLESNHYGWGGDSIGCKCGWKTFVDWIT